MSIVIDANMKLFAERINITSSRMIKEYGLSTVDEIIEAEAEKGNDRAVRYAREYYHSPDKLIKLFKLTDVENKFVLLHKMDDSTRAKVMPLLEHKDLVMGLYFFTQEKLLKMLMEVDIKELIRVVLEAFPLEEIMLMIPEEDLAKFMLHKDLDKDDVVKQLKALPPEVMQKFLESVTGRPAEESNAMEFIKSLEALPEDKFKKFMSFVDPDVLRQLTFQLTKEKPEYLTLFEPETYVNILSTMFKPDMIKPMIMLNHDSLVNMITELPPDLMSIVGAQIDERVLAKFLQDGHMEVIERAMMV